jgi:predicted O-methyltransferase YrrM
MQSQMRRAKVIAALGVRHPSEFRDRFLQRRPKPPPEGPSPVPTESSFEEAAHRVLGLPSQDCDRCANFDEDAAAIRQRLTGHHHMDAGIALGRTVWTLTRHLQPASVVETGVARGVTSAFILKAMQRNGTGHLWSVDLPPVDPDWQGQSGIAVDDGDRSAWTYVRGSSLRKLPEVFRASAPIDIFIHDSSHDYWTMTAEYEQAWDKLKPGGVLVSDDIDDNPSFPHFAERVGQAPVIAGEEGKIGMIGLLRR